MQKSTFNGLVIFAIILIGGFMLTKSDASRGMTGNAIAVESQKIQGEMQRVILSQDGYNYKDATAQAGKPIVISADSSVGGCLRSAVFNIDGKKYSKYLRSPEDTLELPALSKGTYTFSCSMGMGFGKLIVQ
jgi:plastocyanin domain-containing protein